MQVVLAALAVLTTTYAPVVRAQAPQAQDPPAQVARLNFDEVLSSEWVSGVDASGTRLLRWRRSIDVDARTGLTFMSFVEGGAGLAEVQVSVDGLNWKTIARIAPDEEWKEVQVNLNDYAGLRVYVQFAYTPLMGETAVWRVVNVRVTRRD